MAIHGSITRHLQVPAADAFALVTNIARLPEWNGIVTRVTEQPATLARDAEWVVELKSMGTSWRSRSRLLRHDQATRRFEYRSQTDDGNPSFGIWIWQVDDDGDGANVTVTWDLHPKTFWRRVLLARVRNRLLRNEVDASLRALERELAPVEGAG